MPRGWIVLCQLARFSPIFRSYTCCRRYVIDGCIGRGWNFAARRRLYHIPARLRTQLKRSYCRCSAHPRRREMSSRVKMKNNIKGAHPPSGRGQITRIPLIREMQGNKMVGAALCSAGQIKGGAGEAAVGPNGATRINGGAGSSLSEPFRIPTSSWGS